MFGESQPAGLAPKAFFPEPSMIRVRFFILDLCLLGLNFELHGYSVLLSDRLSE